MIQPNELRLGNFVGIKSANIQPVTHGVSFKENKYLVISVVISMTQEMVGVSCKFGRLTIPFDRVFPIPIAEKQLLGFGAEFFGDGVSLLLQNRLIKFMECRNVFVDAQTSVEFTSAHQMQNFFFSQTGKEIIFK